MPLRYFKKTKIYFILAISLGLLFSFLPSLCFTKMMRQNDCPGCCKKQAVVSVSQVNEPACCQMDSAPASSSPVAVSSHFSASQEFQASPNSLVLPVVSSNSLPKEILSKASPPSPPLFLSFVSFLC